MNPTAVDTRLIRAAWAVVALMLACAFSLNGSSHYVTVLAILTLAAAGIAAVSPQASLILVAATPALDSFGVLAENPQVVTVFQVVLIASIVGMVYRLARRRDAGWRRLTVWDVGILMFLVAAVVSVPLSHNVARSLVGAVQIAALVGMYALLSRATPPGSSATRVAATVVFVGVASAVVAIGQAVVPHFPVPLLENHPTGSSLLPVRVSAFFANPNSLAVLLALAAIIAAGRVLRSRTVRDRPAWAAAGLVCCVGLALTFSREGLVGLLVGLLVLILIASPDRRTTFASLIVLVVLSAGVLAVPGIAERAGSIYAFANDRSAMDRVYLSEVSLKMFKDHPIVGVGISAFTSAYPEYTDPRVAMSPVTDGHQMPFSIPAETGVLGLAAEFVMVGSLLYVLRKAKALSGSGADVSGIAAACAFFAMSFFNVFYYAKYFWITLALVALTLRSTSLGIVVDATKGRETGAVTPWNEASTPGQPGGVV